MAYWVDIAKRIEDMGATSICIKDMAGLLVPYKATELIGALHDAVALPIQLHTHYTSGVASMTYLKAVEAGVDVIDTAMSPFALGTSQDVYKRQDPVVSDVTTKDRCDVCPCYERTRHSSTFDVG